MPNKRLTKRQKESFKINRKRAVRQWWRMTSRRFLFVCALIASLAIAVGGCVLWRSADKVEQLANTMSNGFWKQTAKLGFKVNNVYLEGRKYTSLADIYNAMELHNGDPLLGVSLTDMRMRLQAIPRVKYAEVARVMPDQLHIHIVEREPAAIWQNNGKLNLVDEDGVIMEYVDPLQYKNLLLVVGEDAPAHIHDLFSMMAMEPDLYKNVAAVLRIGQRRWNVRFKNGIELKLPEKDPSVAWKNFADIEQENHIMERAVKSVDMRLSDRIFIKYAPSEMINSKSKDSET